MYLGQFERSFRLKRRQDGWQTLGEHCLVHYMYLIKVDEDFNVPEMCERVQTILTSNKQIGRIMPYKSDKMRQHKPFPTLTNNS